MRSRPCRHFCYSGVIGILSPHRREDSSSLLAAPHATTISIDINNGQRPLGDWVRTMFKRTTEHELFLLLAMCTKVAMSGMPHNISDLALKGAFIAKHFLLLSTVLFFFFLQATVLLLLRLRTVRTAVSLERGCGPTDGPAALSSATLILSRTRQSTSQLAHVSL